MGAEEEGKKRMYPSAKESVNGKSRADRSGDLCAQNTAASMIFFNDSMIHNSMIEMTVTKSQRNSVIEMGNTTVSRNSSGTATPRIEMKYALVE